MVKLYTSLLALTLATSSALASSQQPRGGINILRRRDLDPEFTRREIFFDARESDPYYDLEARGFFSRGSKNKKIKSQSEEKLVGNPSGNQEHLVGSPSASQVSLESQTEEENRMTGHPSSQKSPKKQDPKDAPRVHPEELSQIDLNSDNGEHQTRSHTQSNNNNGDSKKGSLVGKTLKSLKSLAFLKPKKQSTAVKNDSHQ